MKRASIALLLALNSAPIGCERREPGEPKPVVGALATTGFSGGAPREVAFGDGKVRFNGPEIAAGARKLPFVLVLHGLGGSGAEVSAALGLDAFAQAKRFLFAAPDGSLDAQGRRFWNANTVCCNFEGRSVDDVGRLAALMDYAVGTLNADPERVFVVGYSNGGFMAHRLACERAARVRAIVSIAAAGPAAPERCEPARAVSVLEIHGQDDAIVPFEGGHLFGRSQLPRTPSVRSGLEVWARAAHCDGELASSRRFDLIGEAPGTETEVLRYPNCRDGSPVIWKVAGAGHVIPLGGPALEAIWRFLTEQQR